MPALARAQDWQMPARFTRPNSASDEGGLWALMDREEARLRRSPFSLRDPELRAYVQQIACRLAGSHCPDIRIHLVRTPYFNATMSPNGMMQVWSGLLLRADNEAQLAAVIGHEIGHYVARHGVERLRDAKTRSAFGQFLGLFGLAGMLGQVGVVAGAFAYSREHEREADRIGALLMKSAGYDAAEAPKVWANLLLESQARSSGSGDSVLFATHPTQEERRAALASLAEVHKGGATHEAPWLERVQPHLREWLADEVKRGQHEESIAFLTRAAERPAARAEYLHARGEVYRLRGKDGDADAAAADFKAAAALGGEPPETHRGLGMIYRARKAFPDAIASFKRYLEAAPQAPDASMIESYLEEMRQRLA